MITYRNALWLVPLILFVTFPLWKIPIASFLAPRGGYDPQFAKKPPVRHNFVMTGVTILHSEGKKQTASIRAASAHTSERPNEYILKEVNADLLNDRGGLTNVEAKSGEYSVDQQRLKLTEDVIITDEKEKYMMITDLLFYDGKRLTVRCPGETKLRGDGITVDGASLGYDIKKGAYTLGGRVFCTLKGYDDS